MTLTTDKSVKSQSGLLVLRVISAPTDADVVPSGEHQRKH